MFSDVLLTADYDRTLTAPDSSIPARNIEAIRYFIENGGTFTINTGRSVPMYLPLQDKIPVNAPLLLYNGSAAYDKDTGELSQMKLIDLPMWQTIRELLEMFPHLTVEIQGVDKHYNFIPNSDWDYFSESSGCAHATAAMDSDIGPFLKFSVYGDLSERSVAGLFKPNLKEKAVMDEAQRRVEERYGDKVEVFRPANRIIDVHAKGVGKGKSARALQKVLKKKILVCVGDADNDLPLLTEADYAFCPQDGAIADQFPNVCPCGEGAVADVIYEKIPEILRNRG